MSGKDSATSSRKCAWVLLSKLRMNICLTVHRRTLHAHPPPSVHPPSQLSVCQAALQTYKNLGSQKTPKTHAKGCELPSGEAAMYFQMVMPSGTHKFDALSYRVRDFSYFLPLARPKNHEKKAVIKSAASAASLGRPR